MEETKRTERTWTWYRGMCGYAVFNNKYKYISHYEGTAIDAMRTCNKWNRENREF